MKHIKTTHAPEPGAYSQGVLVGSTLYLAGQTGNIPGVKDEPVIDGGIFEQTDQALENLLAVVSAAGGNARSFVVLEIFLKDSRSEDGNIEGKKEFERAYKRFFEDYEIPKEKLPARCLIFVADVPLPSPIENTLVEIKGIAEI